MRDRIMNIYETCPILENENYILRLIEDQDALDLFDVYHDKLALPFFNSDNCHGSNFYCASLEDMKNTIHYWLIEYHDTHGFVRLSIFDKKIHKVIGTIEIFKRVADDYFTQCGLLRIDLGSHFEKKEVIQSILDLIVSSFFDYLDCKKIATKAPVYAIERIEALQDKGFKKSTEILYGHHQEEYYDYWVIER